MNLQHSANPTLNMSGSIERVTFHSVDTGFCVLRVKAKGHREQVTVIGSAPSVTAGEYIDCSGIWTNDRNHGQQFKANSLNVVAPTTLDGIEKYLGSGMVKGIGPHFAKKLVIAFGENVFDIIEKTPERLLELNGVGKKRQVKVTSAWCEQKFIREIMVFLQSHGVSSSRAVRIYKTYGDKSIQKVKENPYRLALDIDGIGFKTADTLAQKLGIPPHSLIRAQAGVRHTLNEWASQGHCASFRQVLCDMAVKLLEIPSSIIDDAISNELLEGNLIEEKIGEQDAIYLTPLYRAEEGCAKNLKRLNTLETPWKAFNINDEIKWVENETGLTLSESQREAVGRVLNNKVTVITGGPGVGKTTLVNSILKILGTQNLTIGLCAPTGRAAKRLSESTGLEAKTIHRLLEYDPIIHGFKRDESNQLEIDCLVIDESSMLDVVLMNKLLKAIPTNAAVLIIGDIDQIPSVSAGFILGDIIESGQIETVRLTEIFRQALTSKIITNAHLINKGLLPKIDREVSDFYCIYAKSVEDIHEKIMKVVTDRIPNRFGFDPVKDIQILTPMKSGGLGTHSLNIELQAKLNGHSEPKVSRFGSTYAPGDKVIQHVNNYDKNVFNGDIGVVDLIDIPESLLYIRFDDRLVEYEFNELDEISLAYAITIHKSQGSEYQVVVLPLSMQHYMLLERNLLYTGVTRGKKLVIVIAESKAMEMAIRNQKSKRRITNLVARLKA